MSFSIFLLISNVARLFPYNSVAFGSHYEYVFVYKENECPRRYEKDISSITLGFIILSAVTSITRCVPGRPTPTVDPLVRPVRPATARSDARESRVYYRCRRKLLHVRRMKCFETTRRLITRITKPIRQWRI